MKLTFDNPFGTMDLESKIRSIFDNSIAGQTATNGNYYCIHVDHKTKQLYALTREAHFLALSLGHLLEEGEVATFNGENVRGMTEKEERLYNEDRLVAYVDLWGNIFNE